MNAGRVHFALRVVLPLHAVLLLSGCAVSTPATVSFAQGNGTAFQSVTLLEEEGESGLRSRFHAALVEAMGNRSIAVTDNATVIGDFAVSARNANLTVQPAGQPDAEPGSSKPRFQSRFYHACRPDRIKATLALYSRDSGAVRGRAEGEFLACPGDFAELNALANLLVEQAMAE